MSIFIDIKRQWRKKVTASAGIVLVTAGAVFLESRSADGQSNPSRKPGWFAATYDQALRSPLPVQNGEGEIPQIFPIDQEDPDPAGVIRTLNTAGPTLTAHNAFFETLGTNGRSCSTCHQPSSGMTISVDNIRSRYLTTKARDPLFAPVDGANCPDAVSANDTQPSHRGGSRGRGLDGFLSIDDPRNPRSLLLNRGVIRIFLPFPPVQGDGRVITPEFQLEVLNDPTGCLINNNFGLTSSTPVLSVYRRPLMASNLKFVTTIDPVGGTPLPNDPSTGLPESGNIMWDGREPTLQSQAIHATLGHAQALSAPTDAQVQEMVDFENAVFSAQVFDKKAHSLTALGAAGGPLNLQAMQAGHILAIPFTEYDAWAKLDDDAERGKQRQSVARGQAIFNTRTFTISNVGGLNDVPGIGNNLPGSCAACHNTPGGSIAFAETEIDQGTTGTSTAALPAPDLPLLKLTCPDGARPFGGTTVTTHDLGKALLTGKCADIGKVKIPQLRGLASRAPYFHNGSAAALGDVVDFYNRRFSIGFTKQEKEDLINFLKTL
jgi:cytochrome c peroxidase